MPRPFITGGGFLSTKVLPITGGTITGALTVTGTLTASGDFAHTGTNLGFYGTAVAARPAAYTQTYATATRTHANLTNTLLTDSTTGARNNIVVDVGAAFSQATLNDNFSEVTVQLNNLRADVVVAKNLANQIIDDLQTLGLLQ